MIHLWRPVLAAAVMVSAAVLGGPSGLVRAVAVGKDGSTATKTVSAAGEAPQSSIRKLMRMERPIAKDVASPTQAPLPVASSLLEGNSQDGKGDIWESISTTPLSGYQFEPTIGPVGASWIMVTPYTGLKTDGVSDDFNAMKCKPQSPDGSSNLVVRPYANLQSECQAAAVMPAMDEDGNLTLSPTDIRYYQFCSDCAMGKRCQLVIWCLDIDPKPAESSWRLYRNSEIVTDMWDLAAGHSMCTLPQTVVKQLALEKVANDGATAVDHQLACQEWAEYRGHGYYQFCGTCRAGNRCNLAKECDRCISFDVTDWHVFKTDIASPPCIANRLVNGAEVAPQPSEG